MRCYLNIPVIGRKAEDIEHSVVQMLEIAKAKWGEDTEVAIPGTLEEPHTFLNEEEQGIHYIRQCMEVLESCDCAIITLDNCFCDDYPVIEIISQVIRYVNIPTLALHCMDWFPDAVQSRNDVPCI